MSALANPQAPAAIHTPATARARTPLKAGSAQALFEAMAHVIEQENYPLLKSYREDFYRIDRDMLANTFSPRARYLWIVREWGTHLLMLGVHERMNREARDTATCVFANGDAQAYTASAVHGLQSVSPQQALAECQHLDYTVEGDTVHWRGQPLASLRMMRHYRDGAGNAAVHYKWLAGNRHEHAHRVALLAIAQSMAVEQWNSLFARCDTVLLDGRCLYDMCKAGSESAQRHAQIVALAQRPRGTAANDANAQLAGFTGFAGSGAAHLSRLAHGQ